MSTVIVTGLFIGVVYGLLGVGLALAYRGSRVVNFAYGETGMVAAFFFADLRFGTSAGMASTTDNGLVLALPVGLLVGGLLGAGTDFFVTRPLRQAPRIRALVGTFAVGSLLFTFAVRRWDTNVRFTKPLLEGAGVRIGGVQVQPQQFLILGVAILVLGVLWALNRFTPFGLRLRSVALDPYGAGLTGVDVNRTSMATWALAGLLAALSAILIAPLVAFNVVFMTRLMLRGLAAALVGGLTSISGAFTAGVIIGVLEGVITFKSPISGITDIVLAGFVLLLMLVRPTGFVRAAY